MAVVACAVGSATACVIPFTSIGLPRPDPKIATRYEPPGVYDQWWVVAESCAHKNKSLLHWKWYAVKAPHLDSQWLDKGLSVERNEVYVREGRTLDRTEVLNEMVLMLTPHLPYSGNTDR